jgi:hypothetical protein
LTVTLFLPKAWRHWWKSPTVLKRRPEIVNITKVWPMQILLCVPEIMAFSKWKMQAGKVKNTCREIRMYAGKWARALNFWWIINSKWFGQSKTKEKNSGLNSLFMTVTIPGTHGIYESTLMDFDSDKKSVSLFLSIGRRMPNLNEKPQINSRIFLLIRFFLRR